MNKLISKEPLRGSSLSFPSPPPFELRLETGSIQVEQLHEKGKKRQGGKKEKGEKEKQQRYY